MVNKSLQPVQQALIWSTGHMHPIKKGDPWAEWKPTSHCLEPFWLAMAVQAGRASLCIPSCWDVWLPLATSIQTPLESEAGSGIQDRIPSEVRLKSYVSILVIVHSPLISQVSHLLLGLKEWRWQWNRKLQKCESFEKKIKTWHWVLPSCTCFSLCYCWLSILTENWQKQRAWSFP